MRRSNARRNFSRRRKPDSQVRAVIDASALVDGARSERPSEAFDRAARIVLGSFLAMLVWMWIRTLRVVVESSIELQNPSKPRVFAFFHGQQMSILAVRRRARTAVMVSLSKDGELQSRVMRRLGFRVIRGSSSRGGARALAGIVGALRDGADAAFAVDGPRGPFGVVKPGAALAAVVVGAELFAVASAVSSSIVVTGAWDRFEIPRPFSRVAIVVGPPVSATTARHHPELLGTAISEARGRAEQLLERRASAPVLGGRISS
jgi:lysophospholipid acyltransferase (LPLAT)-like uncharacterized protein